MSSYCFLVFLQDTIDFPHMPFREGGREGVKKKWRKRGWKDKKGRKMETRHSTRVFPGPEGWGHP